MTFSTSLATAFLWRVDGDCSVSLWKLFIAAEGDMGFLSLHSEDVYAQNADLCNVLIYGQCKTLNLLDSCQRKFT